jgi:hypothetical protein
VWLADFGLTAELEGTHAYVPPIGSLDHVPPEWWSERTGDRGAVVRPTADIWAFGVLAHQVLTGGLHPFVGATARALAAQAYARGAAPLRLDDAVPDGWRRLITECLAPDHVSRARLHAADLSARVRVLCGAPHSTRRPRRSVLLLASGAALLAAAAGTGVLPATGGHPGRAEVTATGTPTRTGVPVIPAAASGAIPADSDVPVALRPHITHAAQLCTELVLLSTACPPHHRYPPALADTHQHPCRPPDTP